MKQFLLGFAVGLIFAGSVTIIVAQQRISECITDTECQAIDGEEIEL